MNSDGVSRRSFLGKTSAALVAAASLPIVAAAQQTKDLSGDNHVGDNERELGPKNPALEAQNPDSMYPPTTDAGGQPPFKYPMPLAFTTRHTAASGNYTRMISTPISRNGATASSVA